MKKFVIVLCAIGVCCALPQYQSSYGGSSSSQYERQSGYSAGRSSYGSAGRSSGGYGGARSGTQYRQENDLSEPAKYEFKYDVNEPEYNVEFGHQEQRDGDNTQGAFYVLLPDGRRQLVEYTADADGFHPRISYQDTGAGRNGNYQSGGYGSSARNGGYTGSQSGRNGGSNYGAGRTQNGGYQSNNGY